MYTVKNISGSKINTPYADFAAGETKTFQQTLKGSSDSLALKFFNESPQFLVTGGVDEEQGSQGPAGADGAPGAPGTPGAPGAPGAPGDPIAVIASGLIAAVQNSSRYGVNVQGGTGETTIANGEIMLPGTGNISELVVKPDAAVDGTASVTVSVMRNGAASALEATFIAADGTAVKTIYGPVAVNEGDLITFRVQETANQAPVAGFQAAIKYVMS